MQDFLVSTVPYPARLNKAPAEEADGGLAVGSGP